MLRTGDCAAFPKGSGNGHHLINTSGAMAVYLEIGSRRAGEVAHYSDVDLAVVKTEAGFRYTRKDGSPV